MTSGETFGGLRMIGRKELLNLVPFTIQHIYRLEKAGVFPGRVKVGRRRVAWVFVEVEQWLNSRMAERAKVPPAQKENSPPKLKPSSGSLTQEVSRALRS